MNLSEMMTFVRTHADTDTTDAPDSTLTVYARAAYNDIKRRVSQWIDNSTSATLSTTTGTAGYALSGLTIASGTMEYVTGIMGPTEKLDYVTWNEYLEYEDGADVDYSTREALYYTVRNNTIYLWPTPSSSAIQYTVYGYRTFTDWPSGSDEPDLPREFDEVICWYMLSRYYMGQEDLELSQVYLRDYEEGVNKFIRYAMRQDAHSPKILGGSRRKPMSYDAWVRRMTEG